MTDNTSRPSRPATITTPTHALAVAIYLFQAGLGITHILNLAEAKTMIATMGDIFTDIWALMLILAGFAAAASVLAARRTPVGALQKEFWAVLALGVLNGFYEIILYIEYQYQDVVITQMFTASIAVGCLCRAVQAFRDRRRALRAIHSPSVAVVAGDARGE